MSTYRERAVARENIRNRWRKNVVVLLRGGDFDESEHPRDEDGKFTDGGGGDGGSDSGDGGSYDGGGARSANIDLVDKNPSAYRVSVEKLSDELAKELANKDATSGPVSLALSDYKGASFSVMNRHLREGTDEGYDVNTAAAKMEKWLATGASKLSQDTTLFRGSSLKIAPKDLRGKQITDHGFTSTSVDLNRALKFARDAGGADDHKYVFEIMAGEGTRAYHWPDDYEHEVVLPAGAKFEVVNVGEKTTWKDTAGRKVEYTPVELELVSTGNRRSDQKKFNKSNEPDKPKDDNKDDNRNKERFGWVEDEIKISENKK